jgi:hypothetical protein
MLQSTTADRSGATRRPVHRTLAAEVSGCVDGAVVPVGVPRDGSSTRSPQGPPLLSAVEKNDSQEELHQNPWAIGY